MADPQYDLAIVGGGINGAGVARDAVGRGLKVLLCEQHDLGAHTSSASTKLIHGGLRYLEQYEFGLVRKALQEREVLLRAAPHIIWPMRFVMPHDRRLRPRWLIRAGLFLYDHLGGRKLLPASRAINLSRHPAGNPLQAELRHGYEYSDCWVEDARLVVLNAMDAAERGAAVLPRTACVAAQRLSDRWRLSLRSNAGVREVDARVLVNAAGPWVSRFLEEVAGGSRSDRQVRMIKGSHIVVPALFGHDYAYLFQNPDGRVVFAIPYERDYTLIGTTDEAYSGNPAEVRISDHEVVYLCETVSRYFRQPVTPEQVVWSYSGVRPLYDDAAENASAITRDYVLDLDAMPGKAPVLSIFGGKITTYRKLAEDVLAQVQPLLGSRGGNWTADRPLPGGDIAGADFESWLTERQREYAWLPQPLLRRYGRQYGTRLERLLAGRTALSELGEHLGDGVYEAELEYLIDQEWVREADDLLWRRSKLGLHVSSDTRERLARWFAARFVIPGDRDTAEPGRVPPDRIPLPA